MPLVRDLKKKSRVFNLIWFLSLYSSLWASQVAQWWRICLPMQEMWVQFLGRENSLEEEMTTYSSILAWKIPWTEKLGGLHSMRSHRVGHDWADTHRGTVLISSRASEKEDTGLSHCPKGVHPYETFLSWNGINESSSYVKTHLANRGTK